jgi:hypothetical protein
MRFNRGDVLTDKDLKELHDHFKELSDLLRISGPVFQLAANEAFRVADRTSMIIQARKEK